MCTEHCLLVYVSLTSQLSNNCFPFICLIFFYLRNLFTVNFLFNYGVPYLSFNSIKFVGTFFQFLKIQNLNRKFPVYLGESYVPLSALQQWYTNFERRLQQNPNFWRKWAKETGLNSPRYSRLCRDSRQWRCAHKKIFEKCLRTCNFFVDQSKTSYILPPASGCDKHRNRK